ncbi:MAG: NAD(P)/FAD-dependent oxidoreductase [Sulfurimonas sp.]|nr:NAD(P)/FAD-dependent oxidoreductase [Sulfurimonas sp.]
MKKIAIIGGGASGLLCAIFCAKEKSHVDIFEQNSKCGKKILVSGNGRCNITNKNLTSNDFFSENPLFTKFALAKFGFTEFEKFCHGIGLLLEVKSDGRAYPLSNEAKSVISLLLNTAKNLGVTIHTNSKITNIKDIVNDYDSVVVATGSEAASHLGGNRDGLNFAQKFGHKIIPTYPSLVQLHLTSKITHKMSGAKINGDVTLLINNKIDFSCSGDILFTNYGISGFAILDISQRASIALIEYAKVDISINLLPSKNTKQISTHINKLASQTKLEILDILIGFIPFKMAQGILEDLKLSPSLSGNDIGMKLSKKIANTLVNWRFEVSDTHGFRHCEVSGGGVDTSEINPQTMQSLKQKNLYFCGEVLDVVGKRGGYNFAWAWASGYLAAQNITNT